jgi:hypothetical protein
VHRRLGFRVLLPAVNLLLFEGLTIWGAPSQILAMFQSEGTLHGFNPLQNSLSPLQTMPRLIAIGINAPSFFLSSLIVEIVRAPYAVVADSVLILMVPFILLFWALIGGWIDGRLGLISPGSVLSRNAFSIPATILAVMMLCLFLYQSVFFLTGGIEGWHGETPVAAASTFGMTAWLTVWLVMLIAGMKHRSKVRLNELQKNRGSLV